MEHTFFAILFIKKICLNEKKIHIFNLIEAYANTQDHAEYIRIKSQIKDACGEEVEGIALLFSNSSGTYGFVTGDKVKIARQSDKKPLKLDADDFFSDSQWQSHLSSEYLVFILENDQGNTTELINQYLQGDIDDDIIDVDVINAINYIKFEEKPLDDMSSYL